MTNETQTQPKHACQGNTPQPPAWRCPLCGRRGDIIGIDCRRWRFCDRDKIRWCLGDNANMRPIGISAEGWHAIVDRINGCDIVQRRRMH